MLRITECIGENVEQPVIKRGPLTFGQLSLWRSIQGLKPEAYNLPQAWSVPTGSTAAVVACALETLENRHETLRTRYEPGGEHGLIQAVWGPAPVQLDVVEADGLPEAAAQAVATELAVSGFDLTRDRPWRACLVSSAGTPVQLVICFHHIAVDAWSINQLHGVAGEAGTVADLGEDPRAGARAYSWPGREDPTERAGEECLLDLGGQLDAPREDAVQLRSELGDHPARRRLGGHGHVLRPSGSQA